MRPNSHQLADCAERFLRLIAAREEVVACRRESLQPVTDWTDDQRLLRKIAKDCTKLLLTASLPIAEISGTDWQGRSITIQYAGGVELKVCEQHFWKYNEEIRNRETSNVDYKQAKGEVCAQLETLAKLKRVQGINSFRCYIRARWDAFDGEVLLSDAALRSYFDEFLAGQSAFTCKI